MFQPCSYTSCKTATPTSKAFADVHEFMAKKGSNMVHQVDCKPELNELCVRHFSPGMFFHNQAPSVESSNYTLQEPLLKL